MSDLQPQKYLDRRDLYVLGIFLLFLLIFFSNVLFLPGEFCLGRAAGDARNQFCGWRAYGFGEIRAGRFPLWNPYEFLGMPFVATLQSAMFYPTNWLCAFLPLGRAINIGIVINLFLSGTFSYLWCRRLGLRWFGSIVTALTYVFGAPQFLRIFEGHWSFLAPMPWIPFILLCAESSLSTSFRPLAIAGGAFAVAMQIFGGNPQYAFYTGISAGIYLFIRCLQKKELGWRGALRAWASLCLMYFIGILVSGVQLLPALELFGLSGRKGQLSYQWVSQYSLELENLIMFLVPDFFGSETGLQYWGKWNVWEMSPYVGIVPLGLALIGIIKGDRRKAALAGILSFVCLLFALGNHAPLLKFAYQLVPGFDLFRAQARFMCQMSLFIGLLAGVGADAFFGYLHERNTANAGKRGFLVSGWGFAAVAVLMLVAGASLISRSGSEWSLFRKMMLSVLDVSHLHHPDLNITDSFIAVATVVTGAGLVRAGILLALLSFLVLFGAWKRRNAPLIVTMLLLLIACDIWTFGRRYLVTFLPQSDGITPNAARRLAEIDQPFRFARGGCFAFPPCEGMSHRFCCIEGVQPNVPARFEDLFWSLQGVPNAHRTSYSLITGNISPFRMLNLRFFMAYSSFPKPQMRGLKTFYEDEQVRIDELPGSWPRAWLVHQVCVASDPDKLLKLLPKLNYESKALLEQQPEFSLSVPDGSEPFPIFLKYDSSGAKIKVEAGAPGILVFSDLFYPGWKAYVDGKRERILCANYVMRAVPVPAGAHEVDFTYEPSSFSKGILLSGTGVLFCAALILLHLRQRRHGVIGATQ